MLLHNCNHHLLVIKCKYLICRISNVWPSWNHGTQVEKHLSRSKLLLVVRVAYCRAIYSLFTFQVISPFLDPPPQKSHKISSLSLFLNQPLPTSLSWYSRHCCSELFQDQGPLLSSSWASFDMCIVSWEFQVSRLVFIYQ